MLSIYAILRKSISIFGFPNWKRLIAMPHNVLGICDVWASKYRS